MAIAARADVTENKDIFKEVKIDGTTADLKLVPVEILPEIIGPAAYAQAGEDRKVIEVSEISCVFLRVSDFSSQWYNSLD